MTHLTAIPNEPAGNTAPNAPGAQSPSRRVCCPISGEDEFSYRNPGVLGESLISTGRYAVETAEEGDHDRTQRILAHLTDRIADAAALDDHTQRHLVESICSALTRAVQYAQYRYLNPLPDDTDDTDDEWCEDPDEYEDEEADPPHGDPPHLEQPHKSTQKSQPASHGRIRIHRPRTPAVTRIDDHADTHDTAH